MSWQKRIKSHLQIRKYVDFKIMFRTSPQPVNLKENSIYVFESQHAPGFQMAMGEWDFAKLCFIRQGSGRLLANGSNTALEKGDVLFLPAKESHRFADDPSDLMTLIMVCFHPNDLQFVPGIAAGYQYFRSVFAAMRPLSTAQTHRKSAIYSSLQRMVFEQTTAREGHEAVNWGLLVQLLILLARTANETASLMQLAKGAQAFARTLDFLDEQFTEQIQIKDLAAMAGVSYRRYTTLFRDAKGETVNTYVTRLRVEFAQKRLLETGNVLFSALDAGFGDLSNFYRVFKKETGLTPRQYIEGYTTARLPGTVID
jgi:AraC-like DNA-binding protein